MPGGTCRTCGTTEGCYASTLCNRCRYAEDHVRAREGVSGPAARVLERAWDAGQVVVALVAELPEPGRHQGASWVSRAACRARPDLPWHQGRHRVDEMRAVCAACPVRDRCLAEALSGPADGVWAATTPGDRVGLRAQS